MNKQKVFENKIKSIIDEYIPKLFLEKYQFRIASKCKNPNAYFECQFVYPYLNAKIAYSISGFNEFHKLSREELKPFIVHELIHLITDPLYAKANARYVSIDEVKDEREALTDLICNIVLNKEK